MSAQPFDLVVIGGGINGCGIARDAAGRGLTVCLAEKGDLAQATSSASTKLFHGGLRYLEYFEFRLVREALEERETLLRAMPHVAWPLRFVLPLDPAMRFAADTPAARLLARVMPWQRGRRPDWMIRAALFLYDRLGGRRILPGTRTLDLRQDAAGAALRPDLRRAFEYSDCWVEDSRLVVLNARDAAARGARVLTRCTVVSARRSGGLWQVALRHADGADETVAARALVNAAGPWVAEVAGARLGQNAGPRIRLVRGSHIVTRRLYDHDRCYFLQGPDGRIVFLIPYERDFTLIGTTDRDHDGPPEAAACSDDEADYLLAFANRYLARPVGREAIVWRYSGVRPLIDEGAASASAATRDYRVTLDAEGAPLLTVHGGKITTYRRLAEAALARLAPALGVTAGPWTAGVPLPGGDFPVAGFDALVAGLRADYPFLAPDHARRLARAYGTEARTILGAARAPDELGEDFGATLTGAELRWLAAREYARTAEDVLWRRSKLGLRLSPAQAARVEAALAEIVRGG